MFRPPNSNTCALSLNKNRLTKVQEAAGWTGVYHSGIRLSNFFVPFESFGVNLMDLLPC